MSTSEHRIISVDTRNHCPVLRDKKDLPEPDLQYVIQLDPDHASYKGATCPHGYEEGQIFLNGFPMLLLEDAENRFTNTGRVRGIVVCDGCRHLSKGFRTRELALKPRVLKAR